MGIRPKKTQRRKPRLAIQRAIENLGIALTSGAIALGAVVILSHSKPSRSPASDSEIQVPNHGDAAKKINVIREKAHKILRNYLATGGPRPSITKDQLTQKERDEIVDAAHLHRLAKKLHSLDPKQFPKGDSWRNHLSTLLGEISGTGPALSRVIRHRHGTTAHNEAIQAWHEAIEQSHRPITESDPRALAIRDAALALLIERRNAGPPQPRSVPDPAPDSPDARDRKELETLNWKLNLLDPQTYHWIGGLENLARLLETVPGHGEVLAKLIRTPHRRSHEFRTIHEKWLNQLESMGIVQYEDPADYYQPRHARPSRAGASDPSEIKLIVKEIVATYPDSAIPIWNGNPKLGPEERKDIRSDYSLLFHLSLKLGKIDPSRFIKKASFENLARLFENDGPEGVALAALFRTNRITEAKQFPDRVRSWQGVRDARKLFDCLENRLESP